MGRTFGNTGLGFDVRKRLMQAWVSCWLLRKVNDYVRRNNGLLTYNPAKCEAAFLAGLSKMPISCCHTRHLKRPAHKATETL